MLAGSEGIGGIYFDNALFAKRIGIAALSFICIPPGSAAVYRVLNGVDKAPTTLLPIGRKEGAELAFDHWLAGEPGLKRVIQDRMGRVVENVESYRHTGSAAILNVTLGTLTNSSTGSITSLVGSGGARALGAELVNQSGGTLTVNQPLTISRLSATHTNNGTITANAGLTVTQSGINPSFTNSATGSITAAAGERR